MKIKLFPLFLAWMSIYLGGCSTSSDPGDQSGVITTGNTIAINGDSIQISIGESVSDSQQFIRFLEKSHPTSPRKTTSEALVLHQANSPTLWKTDSIAHWNLQGNKFWVNLLDGILYLDGDSYWNRKDIAPLLKDAMIFGTHFWHETSEQKEDAAAVFALGDSVSGKIFLSVLIGQLGFIDLMTTGDGGPSMLSSFHFLEPEQWHYLEVHINASHASLYLNDQLIALANVQNFSFANINKLFMGGTPNPSEPKSITFPFTGGINYFLLANNPNLEWAKQTVLSQLDCQQNPEKCPTITDSRDQKKYQTIIINKQQWMAQNLNYGQVMNGKLCPQNTESGCDTYGGLYKWSEFMDLDATCNQEFCAVDLSIKHSGICPEGYRIPDDNDWKVLELALGMPLEESNSFSDKYLRGGTTFSQKIRSANLWKNSSGSNIFAFNILPAGYFASESQSLIEEGESSVFASHSQSDSSHFLSRKILESGVIREKAQNKADAVSVRCVRDLP